jgi:hypothetical protein
MNSQFLMKLEVDVLGDGHFSHNLSSGGRIQVCYFSVDF